jgi:nucleotide-binding universal stress UspA family protein
VKTHDKEGGNRVTRAGWILAGVDFSRPARQALIQARQMARQRDSTLMVLHVIDPHGLEEVARLAELPEKHLRDLLGRERRKRITELLAEVDDGAGEIATEVVVTWGHPFEEILKKAADLSASLIVLGTHGRSADLQRALFGSTAEKVLRATPCAVLCVPMEE